LDRTYSRNNAHLDPLGRHSTIAFDRLGHVLFHTVYIEIAPGLGVPKIFTFGKSIVGMGKISSGDDILNQPIVVIRRNFSFP
jgi:hypothetical protein